MGLDSMPPQNPAVILGHMLLYSVVAPLVCMLCRSLVLVFVLRRIRSIRSGCVGGGVVVAYFAVCALVQ